jgi:late competence protein required for DNA uptake (superfamily II DNA/RNA helicase)
VSTAAVTLRQRRCSNHPTREASARCPECGQYYCRECITEHDDRVLCASCLAKISLKKEATKQRGSLAGKLALAFLALIVTYALFLLIGTLLLSVPTQFHSKGGW